MVLAAFEFNYQTRNGWKLPICQLDLLGPAEPGRKRIDALVDSGASYSIFLRSDADLLGIELPRLPNQRIAFGSGPGLGRRVRVALELGSERFRAEVVFIDDES